MALDPVQYPTRDQNRVTWRRTSQPLMPCRSVEDTANQYDIYPAFSLTPGQIHMGRSALAEEIVQHKNVLIDGYGGVFWENLRALIDRELTVRGKRVHWFNMEAMLRPPSEIERLVQPFLGGDDPLFGTRFNGTLQDFFKVETLQPDDTCDINVVYGCGAALVGWPGLLIYVDVPKNEIQYRSRAGSITNLGCMEPADPKAMYKRFYFVDWVALNQHKANLLPRIDILVDEQRPDEPTFIRGNDLRHALIRMSRTYFRVRPWFEPGVWGGQWIKANISGVSPDVRNYAWSFELITPENGLIFESGGLRLEVSFDCLMAQESQSVLGDSAVCFGDAFPIRFDFLDTMAGDNLSIQCHPSPAYIRQHFGEPFTQDETYYLLACQPDARVYLGFVAGITPEKFSAALEDSQRTQQALEINRFVYSIPSEKHGLYLIPNGTIHGAGKDNLVLEISATPYIFTFKIYDWLRLDLDGKPRPLNLKRAFDNLSFERQGERIEQEFVSHPAVIDRGADWCVVHLPTHRDHFYDVHRLEFADRMDVLTDGSVHVLSLVEGDTILLETADGLTQVFHYAETFAVPAAAGHYRLINQSHGTVKVIKAFIKKGYQLMSDKAIAG